MEPVAAVVVLAVWLGVAGLLIIPALDFLAKTFRRTCRDDRRKPQFTHDEG